MNKYEKSDRSLKVLRIIIYVITVILLLSFIISSIVVLKGAFSDWVRGRKHIISNIERHGSEFGLGFGLLFGGLAFTACFYLVLKSLLWTLYDIKVIRTAVTGSEFTKSLSSFTGSSDPKEKK